MTDELIFKIFVTNSKKFKRKNNFYATKYRNLNVFFHKRLFEKLIESKKNKNKIFFLIKDNRSLIFNN
tara:strand:+ start:593 stop:796 length:204 start_codon:yes stop_codon:yes gene_type:complete